VIDNLRICHISSMHEQIDDRIFQRCCLALVREGCEVSYIVQHENAETILGVKIVPLRIRSGWKRRIFSTFEAYRKAVKTDADIYQFHDFDLLPWMYLLAKKKKVVYDIHENILDRTLHLPFPKFATYLIKGVENFIVRKLAGIVPVSDSLSDIYKGNFRKSCVVHNVVNLERMKAVDLSEVEKEDYPVIYTSGNLNNHHNCRETINAMPYILKRKPDVILRFAGSYGPPDDYREELEQLAKSLGVEKNVQFQGMLPWLDNFKRTTRAHIGLVVMEDNPNAKIALSNRFFEFLYCKIPVIVEDIGEFHRLILETNCAVLVDSTKPEQLADAVIFLLDNPVKAAENAQRGYELVMKKYNIESEIGGLMRFYRDIVSSN